MTTHARLVLLRHGKSVWNEENRFTGWADAPLADAGKVEAKAAAAALMSAGICFDAAYTSYLQRAIRTLWIVLEEMNLMWLPQQTDWRFNERHYGALQGLNKAETAAQYGDEQVQIWRRSYAIAPPPLENAAAQLDSRYANVTVPNGESLKDVTLRIGEAFDAQLVPKLSQGKNILLVSHGNALRALIRQLDNIGEDDIMKVEIPTGAPLLYELDANLKPLSSQYL